MYVADLLGTGSEAVDMNDLGVAVGVRSIDTGCGFDCMPTLVEGVWTGIDFVPLPWLPQWENINFPFRYYNTGEWQSIWPSGGIDLSPFGAGSITNGLDIALTISASGLVAPGPTAEAVQMTSKLSPAYGDASVTEAEARNENGEILGEFMLGHSQRLMRFVAAEECIADCIRISSLRIQAQFVDDPSDPGRCVGVAFTRALVRLQITDENGTPLEGVIVEGRFMDDEWLDQEKRGVTDSRGFARVRYRGSPCTGAIAFLVTSAELGGRTLDRINGTLQAWMIPE